MTLSFRTRIFITAVLIVGSALSAVLLLGWASVLAFEIERLDDRLCMEAHRLATQPLQDDGIARMEVDVMGKLHLSSPGQLMLRYESTVGGKNFQSENWLPVFESPAAQWRPARSSNFPATQDPPPAQRPNPPEGQPELQPPDRKAPPPGLCALASVVEKSAANGRQWHVARSTTNAGFGLVAVDLAATEAELRGAFSQALRLVIPLALALAALGAWLLSVLMMRPLDRLRDAMKDVTKNALDQRLSTLGEDHEFKVLIDAYNTMLARLEASFQQASRFSADAAHELKTPLTILQGRIEQALNGSDHTDKQAELTEMLDEVGRLSAITRKLLLLSQADAGWLTLQLAPVDLSRLLDEAFSDMQMLLTDQTLKCEIDRPLSILGDAVLLQQLFNNLISNAIRYCAPGGLIQLSSHRQAAGVEVLLSNATHPIAAEERARFFDRFYRGDAAHNRRIDGNGLGLSLAREIARAHGGDLTLIESAGTVVTLRLTLPLPPPLNQTRMKIERVNCSFE
jgi:two-component system, OmpR family, heavy metal sensor histidine kinase CusS